MKNYQTTAGLIAMLAITSTAAFSATIPNYADADLVLGQVDFTSKLALNPPNAASLRTPNSVIVDPVTRKVFVSEDGNNRVLRYASANALTNGAPAEVVFGQLTFATRTNEVAGNRFGGDPASLFLDAKGRLWVPEFGGDRVLMFKNASTRLSGASADRVFGQPDFTTGAPGTTAAIMRQPNDVCVDANDRLWVADTDNNRVLRFDDISNKPNGAAADGVLGQVNFTNRLEGLGSDWLQLPTGVTISSNGTLYVTCRDGNRVLRFDKAATLKFGAPASAVLGQPDFLSTAFGLGAGKMSSPRGAWITPDDSLWVADSGNNRLLRFSNASSKANGAAADGVLGQPNFTSNLAALTRRGMDSPTYRPFVDAVGSLWIADGDNNRVLRFSPDTTPPLLTVTKPPKATRKPKITIKGKASDAIGIKSVDYQIGTGPLKKASGTKDWSFKVKLKLGKNVITVIATDVDGIVSKSRVIKIKRK